MRLLILALAILALAGCDTARQINVGAPIKIYLASPERIQAEADKRGAHNRIGRHTAGFYDRLADEVWLDGSLDRDALIALVIHEFCHATHDDPQAWQTARNMSAPGFPVGWEQHEDVQAMTRAWSEPWQGND
jgi:hypothetical protein